MDGRRPDAISVIRVPRCGVLRSPSAEASAARCLRNLVRHRRPRFLGEFLSIGMHGVGNCGSGAAGRISAAGQIGGEVIDDVDVAALHPTWHALTGRCR